MLGTFRFQVLAGGQVKILDGWAQKYRQSSDSAARRNRKRAERLLCLFSPGGRAATAIIIRRLGTRRASLFDKNVGWLIRAAPDSRLGDPIIKSRFRVGVRHQRGVERTRATTGNRRRNCFAAGQTRQPARLFLGRSLQRAQRRNALRACRFEYVSKVAAESQS